MQMPRPRPPHLHREETRHGAVVWYVRRHHGQRIRIRAEYDSPEFWTEYRTAIEGTPQQKKAAAKAHTLAWALELYRYSSAWAGLSNGTRSKREGVFRAVTETAGHHLLKNITADTIKAGRERRQEKPGAANEFIKAMRGFFKWAADPNGGNLISTNPTIGIKTLKGKNKD